MKEIARLIEKVRLFERRAHSIPATHEASKSRIVVLGETYSKLKGLSLKQDDLLRQSLRCIETGLFRAAHVMGWAGFIDFIEEKLASDGFKKVKGVRPKWSIATVEDLRENYADFQVIEVAKLVGICNKTEMKALHGLLNKRNESAHPSDYFPDLNETLGYLSEILHRIQAIQPRRL
jgi:hypothetical protein